MTTKNPKNTQTREDLLAALAAVDKADEIASLKTQIADLTATVGSLTAQRQTLTQRLRERDDMLENVRKVVGGTERRSRMEITNAARIEATRVEATRPKPLRTMAAGSKAITDAELSSVFPEIDAPVTGETED